jgi:predicted TIM-barrel fold metal-dependent hydrolase
MSALSKTTQANSATVTAVDCHAHVMSVSRPLSPERHSAPIRDVTVKEYLGVLDAHGISHGLLTAPSFYGSDNGLLLDALASYPHRLRGTAIVEPTIGIDELNALQTQGICGVRLNWIKRSSIPDVSSPAYQRLLSMIRDAGMHVEVFLEGGKLASVLPHISKTGVRVVLDHFGCPSANEGVKGEGFQQVLSAVASGNTWVKLSAPYRLGGADPQAYVNALLLAGGPQRLMWATDWPWVGHEKEFTYQQCLDWLLAWIPDDETRRIILADTPRELFGF